eukprot:gene13193-15503_t
MDVFGEALKDQFIKGSAEILWLHNSYGEPEEMPLDIFFRNKKDMPEMELKALDLCKGHTLDLGAGAGSHALLLQQMKKEVTALDISPGAVSIMKQRGVKNILEKDIFALEDIQYDTLLFLMNGIGVTGTISGLKDFLVKAASFIKKDGQLIFDSSDIAYLYQHTTFPDNKYYGEVAYQYQYRHKKGNWFNWLYIDQQSLALVSKECGWNSQLLLEDEYGQYLVRLTRS